MSGIGARPPRGVPGAVLLLVVAALFACERTQPVPRPSIAALEDSVRRFYVGMAAEDAEENRRAMQAMVPNRDDFAALFPNDHQALWDVWSPERTALVENAAIHSEQYRNVLPLGVIHTGDLRVEGSIVLQRSLQLLPADVPVLGVRLEVAGPEHERAATSFVYIRDRWVWVWDLERAAAIAESKRLAANNG